MKLAIPNSSYRVSKLAAKCFYDVEHLWVDALIALYHTPAVEVATCSL